MSVFEPDHIIALAKLLEGGDREEKREFEQRWRAKVEERWKGWHKRRPTQSQYVPQLEWEAHIVEYVRWAYRLTKSKGAYPTPLKSDVPILGPRFIPPSYFHSSRRSARPEIHPETAYLKPLTVIHPLFFPELAKCPKCDATGSEVAWSGWTTTGHCEVHGLDREETALGYQLRCDRCNTQAKAAETSSKNGEGSYCFSTTNYMFWERREHWEVPTGIPCFTKRCALSRELFNLIIEFRLTMTSAGLADHIKQLHLRRYHQERLVYLSSYQRRLEESSRAVVPTLTTPLRSFSKPEDLGGYCDVTITDDFITDIYLKFSKATRVEESNEHLRTLTAVSISVDQTFRAAGKAKLVTSTHKHEKTWGGGILNTLNERGQTLAWQFCQTQANAEIEELLRGIKNRFCLLKVPEPEIVVADNCCHIRKAIKNVFPDAHIGLDVWHMLMRYNVCILGGSGNQARPEVTEDIVSAILKTRADKYNPASYWPREEQEKRLDAAFKKWAARGVWNAAATKTHNEQMKHVRKGCLTRPRNDIRSDGSRIEGTHKAWNSLQRSHSSGLEMLTMLSHDLVLRRNHRIDLDSSSPTAFALSTFGSHHLRLVNHIAHLWNSIIATPKVEQLFSGLAAVPTFQSVNSGERFGIVQSQFATGYQYMIDVKTEDMDGLLDLSAQPPDQVRQILESMNVSPTLLSQPLPAPAASIDATSSVLPSLRHTASSTSSKATTAYQEPSALTSQMPRLDPLESVKDKTLAPRLQAITVSSSTTSSSTTKVFDSGAASAEVDEISSDINEDIVVLSMSGRSETCAAGPARSSIDVPLPPPPTSQHPRDAQRLKRSRPSATPELDNVCEDRAGTAKKIKVAAHPDHSETTASVSLRVAGSSSARNEAPGPGLLAQVRSNTLGNAAAAIPSQAVAAAVTKRYGNIREYLGGARQGGGVSEITHTGTPADLKLPKIEITGLTPSQRIFSIATGLNPLSLAITSGDEFFLFMNLRAEHKWASYNMSSSRWAKAADVYNTELENLNRRLGHASWTTRKTPRALMDKLSEVESMVVRRLVAGDYKSKESGSEEFWRKHCHAVPLFKGGSGDLTKRKLNTCTRCKMIMWPGPKGSPLNHKRAFCSDGVRMKPQVVQKGPDGQSTTITEDLPSWPQPAGIFEDGTTFHPTVFLRAVAQLYSHVVARNSSGGEYAMEYLAFAEMLHKRTIVVPVGSPSNGIASEPGVDKTAHTGSSSARDSAADGQQVLFRLFDSLTLGPCPSQLLVTYQGMRYLSVTTLLETVLPVEEEEEADDDD